MAQNFSWRVGWKANLLGRQPFLSGLAVSVRDISTPIQIVA